MSEISEWFCRNTFPRFPSVNSPPSFRMRLWWYSLLQLITYLAVFRLWQGQEASRVHLVGALGLTVLVLGFIIAGRSGYFRNVWDAVGHATVILDVLLEAFWVRWHPDASYLACALAFALVLGGYRGHLLRRRPPLTERNL